MRLSVTAGTSTGKPASSTASRPMLAPCSPAWLTQPVTTSSIFAGGDADSLAQARQRGGQQRVGADFAKRAPLAAKRSPHGFDHDGLWHDDDPSR